LNNKHLSIVLLILAMSICVTGVLSVHAAPSFTLTAKTTKTAYYLGEDVTFNAVIAWSGLSRNYTVDVQLWNSTAALETLESSVALIGENGSLDKSYTVNELTEKVGTSTYNIKFVETTTGLTIASAQCSILVQDKSVSLAVAWADSNSDRVIDAQESVSFTIYINWAFINETTSAVLIANDNGYEKVIDSVTLSAGSGSAQKMYVTSFDSAGIKTLHFWLEDAAGKQITGKAISLTVGQQITQQEGRGSILDTVNGYATQFAGLILVAVVIAIVVIYWKLRR